MNSEPYDESDVVVIGGGLAGLASAIHLSRAGLGVICLEPVDEFQHIVGESLDWSAPELFQQFGLEMDHLVQEGIATYKRHVILQLEDGPRAEYVPSEWLGRPPFNVELRTLHLDRVRLHRELREIADACGVQRIAETAAAVERAGKRLRAVQTSSGNRYAARWFIDASGHASSFLGRTPSKDLKRSVSGRTPRLESGRRVRLSTQRTGRTNISAGFGRFRLHREG